MSECDADAPSDALDALADGEYAELRPAHRLALLVALSDAWLCCWTTSQLLRDRAAKQQELQGLFTRRTAERAASLRGAEAQARAAHQPSTMSTAISNSHHSKPLIELSAPASPAGAIPDAAATCAAAAATGVGAAGSAVATTGAAAAPAAAPAAALDAARAAAPGTTTVQHGACLVSSGPCEHAALALVRAIESDEESNLRDAIERATPTHSGIEGIGHRHWVTSELHTASAALAALRSRVAVGALRETSAKEQAGALGAYLHEVSSCAVRELPLGSDHHGRCYWHFAEADDARLWVVQTQFADSEVHAAEVGAAKVGAARRRAERASGPGGPARTWRFYHTTAQVEALLAHLDATNADLALRAALRERLPLWSERWPSGMNDPTERWVEEGHAVIGRRVLRSFPGMGTVLGRVCSRLPLGTSDNDEELFKVCYCACRSHAHTHARARTHAHTYTCIQGGPCGWRLRGAQRKRGGRSHQCI